MIEVKKYTKILKKRVVLDNISYTFKEGRIYLLEGHNGSGKTMLLRAICNLIKPTSGTIERERDYSYGVIIENPDFINYETGLNNLKYLASINKKISQSEILEVLNKLDLYNDRNRKVKEYSLGMKKRLGICQAIMENQDVLLLDEPFNALDEKSFEIVKKIILEYKSDNKIIIVAAHGVEPERKTIFDETIKLDNGKLISQ